MAIPCTAVSLVAAVVNRHVLQEQCRIRIFQHDIVPVVVGVVERELVLFLTVNGNARSACTAKRLLVVGFSVDRNIRAEDNAEVFLIERDDTLEGLTAADHIGNVRCRTPSGISQVTKASHDGGDRRGVGVFAVAIRAVLDQRNIFNLVVGDVSLCACLAERTADDAADITIGFDGRVGNRAAGYGIAIYTVADDAASLVAVVILIINQLRCNCYRRIGYMAVADRHIVGGGITGDHASPMVAVDGSVFHS